MQDTIRTMRNRRAEGDRGFTLIELLVVVVILGVLVAIAVPVYLNYRQGAADKSAMSDVRGAITAVENYYTMNSNAYPTGPTGVQNAKFDLTGNTGADDYVNLSDGTQMIYVTNANGYAICAQNDNGETVYRYSSVDGGSVVAVSTTLANCAAP